MRILIALLLLASPVWAGDFVTQTTTDVCHDVFVSDSTSSAGAGLTGLAHDAAGLVCKYKRSDQATGSIVTMSLVDGTVGTHLDNSWKEIGDGLYQLCPPDAAYSAGRYVTIWCAGATSMAPMVLRVSFTEAGAIDANCVSGCGGGGGGGRPGQN